MATVTKTLDSAGSADFADFPSALAWGVAQPASTDALVLQCRENVVAPTPDIALAAMQVTAPFATVSFIPDPAEEPTLLTPAMVNIGHLMVSGHLLLTRPDYRTAHAIARCTYVQTQQALAAEDAEDAEDAEGTDG